MDRITRRPLDIIVIDDEFLIRWAISRTLAAAGHRVREAGDARSAISMLRSGESLPDVVLLDYRLPGVSGLDLLSAIRALSPHTAIVMMSADTTPDTMREAVKRGAYRVMQKPFDMEMVEPALLGATLARQRDDSRASGR